MEKAVKNKIIFRVVCGALAVGALTFFVFMFRAGLGCNKEWWEYREHITVEFSDPYATPGTYVFSIKEIESRDNLLFTYVYDGMDHYPDAKILYKGEERGYVYRYGIMVLGTDGIYHPDSWIRDPGKYWVTYALYPTQNTSSEYRSFWNLKVYIEIIENI